jgi:hypothetical protein
MGPPIEPFIKQPIEPPVIAPMNEPPPLVTPEPDSWALFGGALVVGIAIAKIKVLRHGRRKR